MAWLVYNWYALIGKQIQLVWFGWYTAGLVWVVFSWNGLDSKYTTDMVLLVYNWYGFVHKQLVWFVQYIFCMVWFNIQLVWFG